jgi:predicted transcriptional regulator of viral defense system
VTTASNGLIGTLVLRMQDAFLDTPGLTLTVREAEQRFGVDEITCQAILGVLAEAGVLARTRHGVYSRFFPETARRSRRVTSAA